MKEQEEFEYAGENEFIKVRDTWQRKKREAEVFDCNELRKKKKEGKKLSVSEKRALEMCEKAEHDEREHGTGASPFDV